MSNLFNDTHREKHPKIKLTKNTDMGIWVIGISNQLVKNVLKLKQNFQTNKVVTGKTPLFVIGRFCICHSICLNVSF